MASNSYLQSSVFWRTADQQKTEFFVKVEIFLEQREVVFLSPSIICENLNFSTAIQIFASFAGWLVHNLSLF